MPILPLISSPELSYHGYPLMYPKKNNHCSHGIVLHTGGTGSHEVGSRRRHTRRVDSFSGVVSWKLSKQQAPFRFFFFLAAGVWTR